MKVLLTAFEPFNNERTNISQEVLELINLEIDKVILPTEYTKSFAVLESHLEKNHYDKIILIGEARKRSKICLEIIAQNIEDATIPDNADSLRVDQEIIEGAPLALRTNFNLDNIEICSTIKKSYHAGNFVCNSLYFKTLNHIYQNNVKSTCIFVHLPIMDREEAKLHIEKIVRN